MRSKRVALTYSDEERIRPYVEALDAAGLAVQPIPAGSDLELDGLDGLVLSGGIDLNPNLYGEERHPEADEPSDARDATELRLLHAALELDLPVLAICRGMQLMNVAMRVEVWSNTLAPALMHRRYDLAKKVLVLAT